MSSSTRNFLPSRQSPRIFPTMAPLSGTNSLVPATTNMSWTQTMKQNKNLLISLRLKTSHQHANPMSPTLSIDFARLNRCPQCHPLSLSQYRIYHPALILTWSLPFRLHPNHVSAPHDLRFLPQLSISLPPTVDCHFLSRFRLPSLRQLSLRQFLLMAPPLWRLNRGRHKEHLLY